MELIKKERKVEEPFRLSLKKKVIKLTGSLMFEM